MRIRRSMFAWVVALLIAPAGAAWAQDYSVTTATSQYEDPPMNAEVLFTVEDDNASFWTLPFAFPYFGATYTQMSVCTNGFVQFGGQAQATFNNTGLDSLAALSDGIVAAYWDDNAPGALPRVKVWTAGTAPNRRVIVAWEDYRAYNDTMATAGFTFQAKLYETSGQITFAYQPGGTWPSETDSSWTIGIDAVGGADSRYFLPLEVDVNPVNNTTGEPPADFVFTPRVSNFTGRVTMDRLVVDATGVGNSLESVPLAGLRVELRPPTGAPSLTGICDPSGNYALRGVGLNGATTGTLAIAAQSAGCLVKTTSAGAVNSFTLASGVSYATGHTLGTVNINQTLDANAVARAPLNIARVVEGMYAFATARTTDPISQLTILYDPASALASGYTPATVSPPAAAAMRVAGAASGNGDGWDVHVIRKTYARHILGAIAATPAALTDLVYDKVTSVQNAFAEAWGYYLNAAFEMSSKYYDGINSTTVNTIDLEAGNVASAKGADVSAWVAQSLFDLTDGANEAWDPIAGNATTLNQVFDTVNASTSGVSASSFFALWVARGYDGAGLSSIFVHHGLLPDDADEPNDAPTIATVMPTFGFLRSARTLSPFNEDWYEFNLAQPTNVMTARMTYDRLVPATLTVHILNASGTIVATGVEQGALGPVEANSGALPAGKYRVRVKNTSVVAVPTYSLQAYPELAFSSGEFQPWTVGQAYDVPVNIKGGVPPYTLTVEAPFVKPPGLDLTTVPGRVTGTPSTASHFSFVLSARDSANPNNIASGNVEFQVNAVLTSQLGEFVAMPLGKAYDRPAKFAGGTAPFTTEILQGALPHGISMPAGQLRFTGTPDTAGSSAFTLKGTDVAASTATGSTTAVVCIPFGLSPLAAGKSACGFWFDAVKGTSIKIAIKTSAKRAKRVLRVALLDTDGSTAVTGTVKGGNGKGSATAVAPATGRFYCVVASDAGDETELSGSVALTPPKKGSGASVDATFGGSKTLTVDLGVLAGAVVSLKATPSKTGLTVKPNFLVDPTGAAVNVLPAEFVSAKGGFTFTRTFATAGTWQLVIGAAPGPSGSFKYTVKITQPKGGVYHFD